MSCPYSEEAATEASCPYSGQEKQSGPTTTPLKPDMPSGVILFENIPQPPEHLFGLLGNLPDMDPSFPFKEIWRLQSIYGEIMKMNLDKPRLYIGTQELVNDLCDQSRFQKDINKVLVEVRALLGDGLFTSFNDEPAWGKAHRMLIPTFGPMGIRKMWSGMQDIASQMVLKWDRLGPEHAILCSDDLTRLAFDTIGLCAFSYRFNQFYSDEPHPFAQQMGEVLIESGKKANRPTLAAPFYRASERKRQENVAAMHKLCDDIVAERKRNPQPDNPDLLNVMLNSVDRETGEGLSDVNIRMQLATFLVAGHETTSATLSFTYYNLLKHPEKMLKAQKQVDEVVGDSVLSLEHVPKLDFVDACIKETLRLSSPINGSTLASKEDQVLAGKYFIPANTSVTFVNRALHHDPKVWGEDHNEFRPERFLNGGFQALPPNSWKPFSTGARACIGRAFAEQEMVMNVAMVLQHFQLEFADPTYDLKLKSTLTIKPDGFQMRVKRRPGKSLYTGIPGGVQEHHEANAKPLPTPQARSDKGGKPLAIYYGGNAGTCEGFAQELQTSAASQSVEATIGSLDSATEHLPTDRPVAIITSSYEGLPADNAKQFVSWLEGLKHDAQSFKGVKYSLFGVGNSDWASTFHRIPKLVNELMEKNGAERVVEHGLTNVKGDLVGPWEEWLEKFLKALSGGADEVKMSDLKVSIAPNPATKTLGGSEMQYGTVIANRQLAGTEIGPAKRHLDVKLPEGISYQAGDYLVVFPYNPPEAVHRVASFFGLDYHDMFSVTGSTKKHLPTEPTPIGEFLSSAVELAAPITKRQLQTVLEHAPAEVSQASVMDRYPELLEKRFSVLDLLEEYKIFSLPFSAYIDMLPALAARQYSISSSSLIHPDIASLTIDVHTSPALSGHGIFQGVCSNYLASRHIGDRISCFIRSTNVGFRIPPPKTPLIMVAAGTGIAPMRAFLQERAAIAEARGPQALGPAILYFGCRHETLDYIFKDELLAWEKAGTVKIYTAFSKHGDEKHHYVPDLMWENKTETADLFQSGGKIFLCGSAARLGKSTADICKKIYMDRTGKSQQEADEWLQSVKTDRYVSDVY
ncbi:Bifunctional cytochrome P450/NADPH--P450 reductase [Pseudocercospora fuligena]|uniref:Bifunctional cytochrome P450/NADPH--P450 reductase n=1 Tax=Pseudocercospora fuligena TaxID=685502 RepID=A0A8H6RLB4_9PEZI|nr:Bifunctional cytochrome P450/NADPH--P450 reductase [Pseudocercospora fuligena]